MKNTILCFSKGTKVLLSNGKEKNIENITVGEEVLSFNTDLNKVESTIVEKIAASFHSIVNVITFSNEEVLVSTTDHPYFVVGKGWASANPKMTFENYNIVVNALTEGDVCLCFQNDKLSEVSILQIETKVEDQEMYVISGGKNNSFFANGIVVSDENIMALNLEEHNVKFSMLKNN